MSAFSRQVSLPEDLCAAVEQKFVGQKSVEQKSVPQEFGNLETFLAFVMGQLIRDDSAALDRDEQRIIEERLRELGYI